MRERFYTFISSFLKPSEKILVAVSGGVDSIVLLDLVAGAKITFAVAHVNFQLRESESDGDEKFVRKLALQYGVPFFTTRFETKAFAEENGISIQMAARQLRYNWFETLLQQENYHYLFTAHHLNDNLETALLNFTRGSGISGLRGIKKQNKKIIRPLLDVSRQQIELYASSNNLSWREDSSNKSTDYHRNFIRHQVIPKLKEINPSLESTYTDNAKRFAAEEELVNFAIEKLSELFILVENNQIKIQKRLFDSFNNKAPVLWEIIKDYGFNLDQCQRIVSGLSGQSGKQFLSTTHSLIIDREALIINEFFASPNEIRIHEDDALTTTPNFELKIERVDSSELKNNPLQAILDKDKIKYPLLLRPWRKGDAFHPLGMAGEKKVSDFLIDIKLSMADKKQVWVLESENKIAWVVGLRIDDRFKITPKTKSALSFKIIQ